MHLISLYLLFLPFTNNWTYSKTIGVGGGNFIVCYGKLDVNSVKGYDLVILEPGHYEAHDIEIFKAHNKRVAAYISLTEVNKNSGYFKALSQFTMGNNEYWESCYIDIRDKNAKKVVLNIVDDILDKGFNALFFDNLDNVSPWGALKGFELDLVSLIMDIHIMNKHVYLIQNAGFFLNDYLQNITNAILVESLFSSYDFDTSSYAWRDDYSKNIMLDRINETRSKTSKKIYVLEYAEAPHMKSQLSKKLDSLKLEYYIGYIELQQLVTLNSK